MRITCPFCGVREHREFSYLGDATSTHPDADAPDQDWFAHVYLRDNPAGPHSEYWQHVAGCRAWLVVRRNTRTHEILDVTAAPGTA